MKDISAGDIKDRLTQHQASGMNVDSRLLYEIEQPGEMYLETLDRTEQFLRLIWQSIDDTRPLAPRGQSRTLADCASLLSQFKWEFHELVRKEFNWFQKCVEIDRRFDYAKLGLLVVTTPLESELRETPHGTWYIYDGAHKSIVLAKKLLRSEVDYKPVELLILIPRRK